jgi:hypothetical protein
MGQSVVPDDFPDDLLGHRRPPGDISDTDEFTHVDLPVPELFPPVILHPGILLRICRGLRAISTFTIAHADDSLLRVLARLSRDGDPHLGQPSPVCTEHAGPLRVELESQRQMKARF